VKHPISRPYVKLEKLRQAGTELSLRKQFCLQYLKWGVTLLDEDRDAFVDMAKRWRKEDKRAGKHRTLLERKARKLFRKVAKLRKLAPSREGAVRWGNYSKEEGIGFHSPENWAKMAERNRKIAQLRKENNTHFACNWIVYSPTGEVYRVRGLPELCKKYGLDNHHLGATHRIPGKKHKGWRAEKLSDDWESI
jgi:hypothetical protein